MIKVGMFEHLTYDSTIKVRNWLYKVSVKSKFVSRILVVLICQNPGLCWKKRPEILTADRC